MAQTYDQLVRLFSNASGLPQPSKSPLRLSALLESGDPNPAEVEKIVHSDPALTAGLLRTASAAAFGRQRAVTTVREAVMVLGFRSIRSIAIALWTQALVCEGKHASKLDLERFSKGSFFTGYLASDIYLTSTTPKSAERWTSEEVFALGVLARLGDGLLSMLAPQDFDAVYEAAKAKEASFQDTFQEMYGQPLSGLAAVAAGSMALPAGLVAALNSMASGEGTPQILEACDYVRIAKKVSNANGMGITRWDVPLEFETCQAPGFDPASFDLETAVTRAKTATNGTSLKAA